MWEWLENAGDVVMSGVIAGMGMVGLVEEAPTHFPLDSMMAGFAERCQLSADLEAFWSSAVRGERLALPEGGQHYFGTPQTRIQEEFREIRIPVTGVWKGHDVEYFAFFAGNENGIAVLSVRFDPRDEGVAETFAPLAEASQTRLAADPENFTEVSTAYVSEDGINQYYCDYST